MEAAAHLAEATEGKAPGISSRLKDRATLGHAKRLVRISKELRRFCEAEGLDEELTRLLIRDTLMRAGASGELSDALSNNAASKLANAEAEIDRVIDLVMDNGIASPAVTDGEIVALLDSGDSADLERLVEGKVEDVISKTLNQAFEEMGDLIEADTILEELQNIESESGMRAYITDFGKKNPDEFRKALAVLVERGDVAEVAISHDGKLAVGDDFTVVPKPAPSWVKRVNELHEYHQMSD